MRKIYATFILSFLTGTILFAVAPPLEEPIPTKQQEPVVKHIRDVSWMIQMPTGGTGSGIMVTRKVNNDYQHFIWTAAHVLEKCQQVELRIHPVTKALHMDIKYPKVEIMQQETIDNEIVGHHYYYAKILRYSEATRGEDLALLQVQKKNLTDKTVTFFKGKALNPGTQVWHVGSMGGYKAPNALALGSSSVIGLTRHGNKIYDQFSIPIQKGSSGGGVFIKNTGECVGLLTEASMTPLELGSHLTYSRPVRIMREYAKRAKCLWAIDDDLPVPSDDEILSTPIEDVPIKLPIVHLEASK